jgi:hypothetical protein
LSEPPDGVTIKNISPVPDGIEIVLQSDAAKTKPGLSGNLIVNVLAGNAMPTGKGKAQVNNRRANHLARRALRNRGARALNRRADHRLHAP